MAKKKPLDVRALRNRLGLNQTAFWSRLGVTQSCGSRYENHRDMPKPVEALVELAYGKKPLATLAELRGVDVDALLPKAATSAAMN